jgi:hypothetical protein
VTADLQLQEHSEPAFHLGHGRRTEGSPPPDQPLGRDRTDVLDLYETALLQPSFGGGNGDVEWYPSIRRRHGYDDHQARGTLIEQIDGDNDRRPGTGLLSPSNRVQAYEPDIPA